MHYLLLGVTGLSRIRGKIEDLAEGVVELRRGQTADFMEQSPPEADQPRAESRPNCLPEVGQSLTGASSPISPN
ncbi:MAG: hypothetical protein A2826_02110 [Candidatus Doudnabacteria bacterium RIFCSPHIGHO2_01_FULL_43_23]|uniref:Uncharacterized protein n=1 Tax=Candidatus Doudnabacteria bacterium RIFCSPHIGHO2_01_FULL_43_23 TaxID=1817822 RepID=A0A1F5NVF0_9BACT|nr:MAG: hypothetical protein A2826_02110 [Candidatus Doudnabacteria bacterium RIFCSPHIGHO2_01_FULL_43_23]